MNNEWINIHIIQKMKENIKQVGKEKTWQYIEETENPITRLRLRKAYYEAEKGI